MHYSVVFVFVLTVLKHGSTQCIGASLSGLRSFAPTWQGTNKQSYNLPISYITNTRPAYQVPAYTVPDVLEPSVPNYESYGGNGEGYVGIYGDVAVQGTTQISAQVPVLGIATFSGDVPASGVITITGNCGCSC